MSSPYVKYKLGGRSTFELVGMSNNAMSKLRYLKVIQRSTFSFFLLLLSPTLFVFQLSKVFCITKDQDQNYYQAKMKFLTILSISLLTGIASAAPLATQHNDEPALLPYQAIKRGDISSTYCDVNPEVFPCSEFCKGNQLADFCRPEYCEHDPGHWSCKPKYKEQNDTKLDDEGDSPHRRFGRLG